ncbi:uncharacterized protein ARMOST_06400 [Armillaria ostoyae]|uniref:Uncharacterized protein n=1 Tax=Armillaria ostoyae TaxID=47428 RepID=A0A284R303_ARMOS|nr:uncharacterized protein ARMOST_06400 [Armillaria ostoyae]
MPSVTHTVLLPILAPRWKNTDFIFSRPEITAALNDVWTLWSRSPFLALRGLLRTCLVSLGGFMLELPFGQLKSFSDHWWGARARKMSIPEGMSKYMQEMGQVEEHRLYGPELENVTPVADNIRLPFLRTLYAGDPRILRSIITPRLEEVHVQPFNKEFREVINLPVLLFLVERSSCSLRKISLEDCIWG